MQALGEPCVKCRVCQLSLCRAQVLQFQGCDSDSYGWMQPTPAVITRLMVRMFWNL
jgi:hypothetical protein